MYKDDICHIFSLVYKYYERQYLVYIRALLKKQVDVLNVSPEVKKYNLKGQWREMILKPYHPI